MISTFDSTLLELLCQFSFTTCCVIISIGLVEALTLEGREREQEDPARREEKDPKVI
jgi:hypothetical protein